MIRTEPNYRDIADAVAKLDEQIKALQDAKKDIYATVRDDHGKKIADQLKLAIKLNAMDGEKRIERDEIEEGAFRILSIIQTPRAPRATPARENIEEIRPADGGANITMAHTAIATDVPHDADGVIIETPVSHSVAPPPPGDADQAGAALVPAAPATISSPACTAADDGQPSIPSSDALAAGPGAVPEGYAKSEQAVSLSDADVPAFLKTGKAA